jgi:hypothetical protein
MSIRIPAPARIRCHVLEVPADDGWLARRGGGPRELLPWADPYIAGLMRRLHDRFDDTDDVDSSNPFTPVEASESSANFDDGWEEDAFMPRPLEAPRIHSYPPVYGGFPLLEDE